MLNVQSFGLRNAYLKTTSPQGVGELYGLTILTSVSAPALSQTTQLQNVGGEFISKEIMELFVLTMVTASA